MAVGGPRGPVPSLLPTLRGTARAAYQLACASAALALFACWLLLRRLTRGAGAAFGARAVLPISPSRAAPLGSCLYTGHVMHRRLETAQHGFSYPVYSVFVEVTAPETDPFAPFQFWRSVASPPGLLQRICTAALFPRYEYLSAAEAIGMLNEESARRGLPALSAAGARVFVLTNLEYWGLHFNSISMYFLYDAAGRMAGAISEVHNTPWGQVTHYVHPVGGGADRRGAGSDELTDVVRKNMHVSPFFKMDYTYHLSLLPPGQVRCLRAPLPRLPSALPAVAYPAVRLPAPATHIPPARTRSLEFAISLTPSADALRPLGHAAG
jgi:hypothetical protein